MGEKSDQIERDIQAQRDELGSNIIELQRKVKGAFDWRVQFEQRPVTMIALALGGGLLLSGLMRGRSRSRRSDEPAAPQQSSGEQQTRRQDSGTNAGAANHQKSSEFWRNINGALAGVVASRFGRILDSIIPSLNDGNGRARPATGSSRDQF
jgi:hypothetical protein